MSSVCIIDKKNLMINQMFLWVLYIIIKTVNINFYTSNNLEIDMPAYKSNLYYKTIMKTLYCCKIQFLLLELSNKCHNTLI